MPTLVMISKKGPRQGLSSGERLVRGVFVVAYFTFAAALIIAPQLRLGSADGPTLPALFWTMGLPLVPLGIVIAGFYPWRKVCPLAFWGDLGRRIKKEKQRRVPKWVENYYPLISLGLLWLALSGRLLSTNGDARSLGGLLVLLALGALVTNWRFTGKTWCNFICPISIVERIYTEPNSLRREQNSQCTRCTACKKNCPDIDQENSYWRSLALQSSRRAYYAFPGLVLAFYLYFWLRSGTWEAYFGGGWTLPSDRSELLLGPGLFFWPSVPAWVAAPGSLLALMLVSYTLFSQVEGILRRFMEDGEKAQHRTFTVAAFCAFNLFYLFAGAPSLLKLPYAPRVAAFIAPLVATLFLVKRLHRSRQDFMEEKSAKKLLRKWKFSEPPPDDPAGVFAYFKAQEAAQEHQVSVYRESVREAYSEGSITDRELQLLELLRGQLNISDVAHREIVEALEHEQGQSLAATRVITVERELQLQGYREALTRALLADADENQLQALRRYYAVSREDHQQLTEELRGERSPILERVQGCLTRARELHERRTPLAPFRLRGSLDFADLVLERSQARAINQALEALPLLASTPDQRNKIRRLVPRLQHPTLKTRSDALSELAAHLDQDLCSRLEALLGAQTHETPRVDTEKLDQFLSAGLKDADPYLRAGAILGISYLEREELYPRLKECLQDEESLVRETAVYVSARTFGLVTPEDLRPLLQDSQPAIRRAAHEAIEALDDQLRAQHDPNPFRVIEGETLPPLPDDAFTSLPTVDKILFLRRVPLFAELDPEDLHGVSSFTTDRSFHTGEFICQQGDRGDDLFVLVAGKAEVFVQNPDGVHHLAQLRAGDVVGELAALDQSPRSASVQASSERLRVLQIPGDAFRRRLAKRSDISAKVVTTLSRRLRETIKRLPADSTPTQGEAEIVAHKIEE